MLRYKLREILIGNGFTMRRLYVNLLSQDQYVAFLRISADVGER